MLILKNIFILLISLVLLGCEVVGDPMPPTTSHVNSRITNFHSSYWSKAGELPSTELAVSFEFRTTDPDGITDLNTIDIVDTSNQRTYNILTRLSNELLGSFYELANNIFRRLYLDPLVDNRVELRNWQVEAKDLQGDASSRSFDFTSFDGDSITSESFVYSSSFTGSTTDGIPAMEAMTIAGNNLSITSDGVQSFTIEFATTDLRASNYAVWFYDDSPEAAPIAIVGFDSASISSTPISATQTTTLVLPWSEIPLSNSVSASSLEGVHVVLYDTPIDSELIANDKWFAYEGVSEFFTL